MWRSWKYYWNFLKQFGHPRLTECTPKQWHAYRVHVVETESCDVRTRRGGKSLMLANLTFFFALIKFGKYEGKTIYRAVFDKQIIQYKEWARKNPFFVKFAEKDANYGKCMYILDSEPASVDALSEASTASLGGSVLLLDEGGKAQIGQVKAEYCGYARGMVVEGQYRERRIIHASTPATNTYFHDMYLYLLQKEQEEQHEYIITMPYQDCPWITQQTIEEEIKLNLNAPWVVPQEFECAWIAHGGNFFDQTHLHVIGSSDDAPWSILEGKLLTHAGLDWNGDLIGHILESGYWDGVNLYLFEETKLNTVADVKTWIESRPGVALEVEGKPQRSGFNAGFSDHLMSLGCECSYMGWEEPGLKDQRLALLQRAQIYVHPSCKWFIKNYGEAAYDPGSLMPALLKTPDQHGLDAVLHLINTGGNVDFATRAEFSTEFDDMVDRVKFTQHY